MRQMTTLLTLLLLVALFAAESRAATRLTVSERFGTASGELPLKSEAAQATVDSQVARTVVTSVFENSTDQRRISL